MANTKAYDEGRVQEKLKQNQNVTVDDALHLSVSMRSFRAESLSKLVHDILELNTSEAKKEYAKIKEHYPILNMMLAGKRIHIFFGGKQVLKQ